MKKIISILLILLMLSLVGCGKIGKEDYYNVLQNYVNLDTETMEYGEFISDTTIEGKTVRLYRVYHQKGGLKFVNSEIVAETIDGKTVEKEIIFEETMYIPLYEAGTGNVLGVKEVKRVNFDDTLSVEEQYEQKIIETERYHTLVKEFKETFYVPFVLPKSAEDIIESGSSKGAKSYLITYKVGTDVYTVTLSKMEKLTETFGKTYRVGKILVENEGLKINCRFALPNMGLTAVRIEDPLKNVEILPGVQTDPYKDIKELLNGLVLEACLGEDNTLVQYAGCEYIIVEGEEYAKIEGNKLVIHTLPLENTVIKLGIRIVLLPEFVKEFEYTIEVESHEHEFVNGRCECGETDYHEHVYEDGVCYCGHVKENFDEYVGEKEGRIAVLRYNPNKTIEFCFLDTSDKEVYYYREATPYVALYETEGMTAVLFLIKLDDVNKTFIIVKKN